MLVRHQPCLKSKMASPFVPHATRTTLFIRRVLQPYLGILRNKSKSSGKVLKSNVRPIKREDRTAEPQFTSLSAKGFLRSAKAYDPPKDVAEQVLRCLATVLPKFENGKNSLQDVDSVHLSPAERFHFLTECMRQLQHDIPNSQLHKIQTVGDAVHYFCLPVKTTTPFDDLARMEDRPANLHVQPDYLRFHPDTDTMFGGKTAFPGSSTVVSGLKYKKKYQGYKSQLPSPTE